MKKLVMAALVLALTAASALALAAGKSFDTATLITGKNYTESFELLDEAFQYWKITPEQDTMYIFNVSTDATAQGIILYDASKSELDNQGNWTVGNNCYLSCALTAGETYYIAIAPIDTAYAGKTVKLFVSTASLFADGTLTISCCDGDKLDFTASRPPWYNSRESVRNVVFEGNVTSVGEEAFGGCYALVSADIPEKVTYLGAYAFDGCSSLRSVSIPAGVTAIKEYTFGGCSSLSSLTLPEAVTSIGIHAFDGCSSLASVVIPDGVESVGEYAFRKCGAKRYCSVQSSAAKALGNAGNTPYSFCSPDYEGLYLQWSGDTLSAVDCDTGAVSVTVPDGVSSVGDSTFSGCSALESVTIPVSVTSVGDNAFSGCEALRTVNYSGTLAQWRAISIGTGNECLTPCAPHDHYLDENGACETCGRTFPEEPDTLTLPDDLTVIAKDAFSGIAAEAAVIPGGVKSVPAGAFKDCKNLKYVLLSRGTDVDEGAFSGTTPIRVELFYR